MNPKNPSHLPPNTPQKGNRPPVPARILYQPVPADLNRNEEQQQHAGKPPAIQEEASAVVYRGGFSTSICDLFQDPHDRTACCALTCCGTFLQDRNQYLLTGERATPWWARLLFYLGGCVIAAMINPLVLLAFIIFMVARASNIRGHLRSTLKQRMREEGQDPGIPPDNYHAHASCFCVQNDKTLRSTAPLNNNNPEDDPDLCGRIWDTLACLCCKACCDCWCACCGVCATAQEYRQLKRMAPKEKFLLDYVTMEPFQAYYPKIEQLRREQNHSFREHLHSLSQLSQKLLNMLAGLFGIIVVLACILASEKLTERLLVMGATFGNAFLILYFTHWRNHKFDISLDVIIKLFGCGFILSVLTALLFETILGIFSTLVLTIFLGIELASDQANSGVALPNGDALLTYAFEHHWATFVVYLFFKSFVEAALVEELTKYYSYFMVEHGDFLYEVPELDLEAIESGDDDSVETRDTAPLTPPQSPQQATAANDEDATTTFQRRKALFPSATASVITVAMVATATGFSCSENLEYIFGQATVQSEVLVLAMRALLPVHSLCAAIQSIGIVRRDVEKDTSYGVGWAIFPAVVLHGTFDFVLFVIGFFQMARDAHDQAPAHDSKIYSSPEDLNPTNGVIITLNDVITAFVPGLIIMALGLLFYVSRATAQRLRLASLDQSQPGIVVSPPFI